MHSSNAPPRAGEIEDINSMNAREVGHLESSTKQQEEENTKNHQDAVERLTKERDALKSKLDETVAKNQT
jgi:hypothetical protein